MRNAMTVGDGDMNEAPTPEGTPPSLRFLKGLVTVLMVTMIAGLITIVALLVIRVPSGGGDLTLPAGLKLPKGAHAQAVTQGKGWVAIVTGAGEILVYDASTGALRHRYTIDGSD